MKMTSMYVAIKLFFCRLCKYYFDFSEANIFNLSFNDLRLREFLEKFKKKSNFGLSCRTQWIYDASDIIYPSIYMSEQINPNDRVKMVRGRIRESVRLAKKSRAMKKPQVIAYYRYVFTDTKKFISDVTSYYFDIFFRIIISFSHL